MSQYDLKGLGVPSFAAPPWENKYLPGFEHKIGLGYVNKGAYFGKTRFGEWGKRRGGNSKDVTLRTHRTGR